MKHQTADLEGALLDAAVAKVEGWTRQRPVINGTRGAECWWPPGFGNPEDPEPGAHAGSLPLYSRSWLYGGPIIERERIELWHVSAMGASADHWAAGERYGFASGVHAVGQSGPTPLIAAMRAFVASKLGEKVEL